MNAVYEPHLGWIQRVGSANALGWWISRSWNHFRLGGDRWMVSWFSVEVIS